MKQIPHKSKRIKEVEERLGEPIEEVLRRLYVDENKSTYTIAREVGLSYSTVINLYQQAGIYSRKLSLRR